MSISKYCITVNMIFHPFWFKTIFSKVVDFFTRVLYLEVVHYFIGLIKYVTIIIKNKM